MSRLLWDQTGEKTYKTGIKKVVLFPMGTNGVYNEGVPWNGVTAVNEEPSGADPTDLYADDQKYLTLVGTEKFATTIEAYMYPDEFEECDGSATIGNGVTVGQQRRKGFGLAYVSTIGNDTESTDYGYEIHLVYGALAAPSSTSNSTINENVDAGTMSWSVSTTPVPVPGHKPTAHLKINSTKCTAAQIAALEDILYGTSELASRLPLPAEIISMFPLPGSTGETDTPEVPEG